MEVPCHPKAVGQAFPCTHLDNRPWVCVSRIMQVPPHAFPLDTVAVRSYPQVLVHIHILASLPYHTPIIVVFLHD